jgi:asparagine synthase (glutamine-hydrolysing)
MCGIVGIASKEPIAHRAWLAQGRDAMKHRGPDDSGEWWSSDGRLGIGHRRLSIIDLSPAGHQPMSDAAGTLQIVFNGEIYNFGHLRKELVAKGHTFRSHSDTEVILAAYREWGPECLSRLNGMFALALYDEQRNSVLLARDRAGEKPLFYSLHSGTLRFSSELKAMLSDPALPRRIDQQALDCYLSIGYVPADRCILQGFSKLPAAHALQFDMQSGDTKLWRYWQLPEFDTSASSDPSGDGVLLDELEALLEDSVRRQLVADVPVGVLLSGGVDSSLVTAMAVRASSRVQTYTIGFPGHGEHDETDHARLIARHFGTRHTELMAEPATVDLLPALARQFDEPMVDSSMIPTFMVSRLVRQHCAVALGGDGGDELFGGYPHYARMLWMEQHLGSIPRFLRCGMSLASGLLPVGMKGRNYLQSLGADLRRGLPIVAGCFDASTRQSLMGAWGHWNTVAEACVLARVPSQPDLLQRATRMDFQNYLSEDILVKVDRSSMLTSLEVRAPFLDYRLVEFAFGKVPSRLKATIDDKKILLKRLTSRLLPPEFNRNRKQGFSLPLADWLRGGAFRAFFNDVLRDPSSVFDRRVVDGLLRGHDRGRSNHERLFCLALFELWRREYRVEL